MTSWESIKAAVEENGNVQTLTMEVLRNALGAGKLGVRVRDEIGQILAGMGLGHVPQELPSYQHEQVRLYKRGTPVGELIETVLKPGELNDQRIVQTCGESGTDYAAIVIKVRELVAE